MPWADVRKSKLIAREWDELTHLVCCYLQASTAQCNSPNSVISAQETPCNEITGELKVTSELCHPKEIQCILALYLSPVNVVQQIG